MPVPLALRIATHLMVFDGIVALYLGGLLGPLGALVVSIAVAASWWHQPVRDRIAAMPRGSQAIIVLVALASAFDILYVAETMLDGLVRLLVFLLVYRLFMRRTLRDARDAGFLSFFMLVAAAPLTLSAAFFFVLLTFLVLGTWTLMLYHILSEAERAPKPPVLPGLGRSLLGLSLAASTATLVVTAGFFFVIPRVGQAGLPLRSQAGRMVSGFSERVEMGAFGEIEADSAVVMRAHPAPGTPGPGPPDALRWRGIAFDHFDGRAWTARDPQRATLARARYGQFDVSWFRGLGPLVAYEVYLEPLGTDILFAPSRVLRVGVRTDAVVVDDMGSISVAAPSARLQYVVQSELERQDFAERVEHREPLDEAALARYLQLPPLPPRIRALAQEVTADTRDQVAAAHRLTDFLSARFRYTRVLERQTTLDPLEEFLFVRRSGNCEYFAAALAVMLRSIGIPARVVNGFQRGEWNPYGRYFMVRLSDAHSWVEAHLAGRWRTFDPSPRGEPEVTAGPSVLMLYLDALRMRWYRYVIDWSLHDQVAAAFKVRQATLMWRPRLAAATRAWGDPRPMLAALIVVVAVAAVVVWSRGHRGTAQRTTARTPLFYARTLKALARRGFRPEPGETAREFSRRVIERLPACAGPLGRLTSAYERVRFGAAALTPEARAELERSVGQVRASASRLASHAGAPAPGRAAARASARHP